MSRASRLARTSCVLLAMVTPSIALADVYSIFNPRPRDDMREMSTDRPDTTESPMSVDAGHVQVELDLVAYGLDRGMVRTTTVDVASTNLKLGLTHSTDLQLVIEPYHRERAGMTAATMATASGYGGTTVRVKQNLWGNDGGATAAALLPFASLLGGAWGAGLAVPIGFELPGGFGAAVMPQIDISDLGGSTAVSGMFTATTSHDLVAPLAFYVEGAVMGSSDDVAVQADGGFTFAVTDDVQLDVGTRVGVIGAVPDIEVFTGLSARR